jgi:hypothetical protein
MKIRGSRSAVEAPFSNRFDTTDVKPVSDGETELLLALCYWKGDMTHGTSMESMLEATNDGKVTFLFVTLDWKPVEETATPEQLQTGQSEAEFTTKLRTAISRAAGIPNAQWEKLATSQTTVSPAEVIEGEPLSIVLLMHPSGGSQETPDALEGFRLLTERMPKPLELHDAMSPSREHGYVSVIQPEYIKSTTLDVDAESKLLRGTVQFEAPKLYAGKVNFAARNHLGRTQVVEFTLPNDGLTIARDEQGVWRRKAELPSQAEDPPGAEPGDNDRANVELSPKAKTAMSNSTAAKPIAHFKFNGSAKDHANAGSTVVLNNPQFEDGKLVLNGKYRDLKDEVFRLKTPRFDYGSFAVAIRFKAESFDGAILCGGPLHRWMVVEQPKNEKLTIRLDRFHFEAARIETGEWYDLVCSHDRESGTVRVCLNGVALKPMQIGKRRFDVEGSPNEEAAKEWVFRNPENAYTFHGLIDEFIVFDRALSPQESLGQELGDETPDD